MCWDNDLILLEYCDGGLLLSWDWCDGIGHMGPNLDLRWLFGTLFFCRRIGLPRTKTLQGKSKTLQLPEGTKGGPARSSHPM